MVLHVARVKKTTAVRASVGMHVRARCRLVCRETPQAHVYGPGPARCSGAAVEAGRRNPARWRQRRRSVVAADEPQNPGPGTPAPPAPRSSDSRAAGASFNSRFGWSREWPTRAHRLVPVPAASERWEPVQRWEPGQRPGSQTPLRRCTEVRSDRAGGRT